MLIFQHPKTATVFNRECETVFQMEKFYSFSHAETDTYFHINKRTTLFYFSVDYTFQHSVKNTIFSIPVRTLSFGRF